MAQKALFITINELKQVVAARDAFYTMTQHPVDKDEMAEKLAATKQLFTKSWALKQPAAAGEQLTASMLTLKKPGGGFGPDQLKQIVGKRLVRDANPEEILKTEDIE